MPGSRVRSSDSSAFRPTHTALGSLPDRTWLSWGDARRAAHSAKDRHRTMIRLLVLSFIGVVFTLVAAARAQPKDPTDLTVVVVHAGRLDWPEARRSVEAELAATGFRVATRPTDIGTPGRLIDELRRATQDAPEVRGSVAVFREGGEGRAYVWIGERENLFQVNAPLETDPMAAEVLSLRIVELLRVRLLDEPPAPVPPPPEPPPEPVRGVSAVWVAAGPWLSFDLDRPPLIFTLAASFRVLAPLDIDVSAHSSLLAGEVSTNPGRIMLSTTALTAHGTWLPVNDEHFTIGVGVGGGAFLFDASALGTEPYRGRAEAGALGLCSARARVAARAGGLSFLLALEPGVTLPAIAQETEGDEVFRFGQPVLLLNAGIGWSR